MAIVGAFALPHPPLIIPAVGCGRERAIDATIRSMEEVSRRVAALSPDTVVISSPHTAIYRDYFHVSPGAGAKGSFAGFGAPQAAYAVLYDQQFTSALSREADALGLSCGCDYERDPRLDHATMIAVHFACAHIPDVPIVRIGFSGLGVREHYRVGRLIQKVSDDLGRRVVYIASGDLSHKLKEDGPYGFMPEGPVFDERVCRDFASADLADLLAIEPSLAERAAECGLRSFQMMVGALDHMAVTGELMSYEGPYGVGYGVAAFEVKGPSDEDRLAGYNEVRAARLAATKDAEDPYVRLARLSLESYVRDGVRITVPEGLPADLTSRRAGCFVSLKIDGNLRGCIGTIAPTQSTLAAEIVANAISAGTRDPRFSPVRSAELADIVYDVDVLGEPEPATVGALDPKRYGVIVSSHGRRGLLLPDLDGVDTVEEQLRIAAQKGGIDLDFDDYWIDRFEVVRHL